MEKQVRGITMHQWLRRQKQKPETVKFDTTSQDCEAAMQRSNHKDNYDKTLAIATSADIANSLDNYLIDGLSFKLAKKLVRCHR